MNFNFYTLSLTILIYILKWQTFSIINVFHLLNANWSGTRRGFAQTLMTRFKKLRMLLLKPRVLCSHLLRSRGCWNLFEFFANSSVLGLSIYWTTDLTLLVQKVELYKWQAHCETIQVFKIWILLKFILYYLWKK